MTTVHTPGQRLRQAKTLVLGWGQLWTVPLAVLLEQEAAHADRLGGSDTGWDRYPEGALLLQLADGLLAHPTSP